MVTAKINLCCKNELLTPKVKRKGRIISNNTGKKTWNGQYTMDKFYLSLINLNFFLGTVKIKCPIWARANGNIQKNNIINNYTADRKLPASA